MPTDRRARLRGGFSLNNDVMRSHLHPIAQNIKTRQFVYDIGALPYTWDTYGIEGASYKLHYLHSSIKGFVDESETIEQEFKLHSFFNSKIATMRQQNSKRINDLQKGARQIKKDLFGGTEDQDVNDTPVIKEFYGRNAEFIKTLNELRSFVTYQFEDSQWLKDKQYLNMLHKRMQAEANNDKIVQQHDKFAASFYQRYAQKIQDQVQKLYNFVNNYGKPASWADLQKILDDITNSLNQQLSRGAKSISFSRKLQLSSRLGKVFEPIVAVLLQEASQDSVQLITDATIANKNFLTDVIISGKKGTTVIVPNNGERLLNGISVKFTSRNSFDARPTIHTNETLLDFTQGMEGNQVDALAYLYNNIVALSLYNSSDRKKGQVRSGLLAGKNRTGRLFFKMLQYYNMYLINTFLWGNAKEAGVQPFNPDFFQNIGSTPAPVFLANQNLFFESWRIFDNMQNTILNGKLIWENNLVNTLFSDQRTGQAALRELYATKSAWLTQSSDAIYTVLRNRPRVSPMPAYLSFDGKRGITGGDSAENIMETFLNPNWNPYRDIIKSQQSRTLRAKIELFKYY